MSKIKKQKHPQDFSDFENVKKALAAGFGAGFILSAVSQEGKNSILVEEFMDGLREGLRQCAKQKLKADNAIREKLNE